MMRTSDAGTRRRPTMTEVSGSAYASPSGWSGSRLFPAKYAPPRGELGEPRRQRSQLCKPTFSGGAAAQFATGPQSVRAVPGQ